MGTLVVVDTHVVALEPVAEEDKAALNNLILLYRYDLSDVRGYELSEHGTFVYRFLDHYWSEPGRDAFFIRVDGRLGGFALAREVDGEHEVAEFFVARRHRRAGVGRRAARLLFARLPGRWSLFHDDANEPAARFWEQVVAEASVGRFECEEVTTSAGFVGRRYRFWFPLANAGDEPEALSDPVEVVDYDLRWPATFAAEAARLVGVLAGEVMAVEHVGSTAVEGLAAKPVIDIQVGVRSLEATATIVAALAGVGYEYVPEYEDVFPRRRYFRKVSGGRRTHQVHLVERADREWWDRHVAFRDWLRDHPDDRDAYAALKRELAVRYRDDREAYTEAKGEFVARILGRAAAGEDPPVGASSVRDAGASPYIPLPEGLVDRRAEAAGVFDRVADIYDQARPRYPDAAIDGLVRTCSVTSLSEMLEIGCGTGQLTRALAPTGASIVALEPGASLAERARSTLAGNRNVEVLVERFEDLDRPPGSFDVVVAATSFHWIDPKLGYPKAAGLLRPEGFLALLTNAHAAGGNHTERDFAEAVRRLHRQLAPQVGDWTFPTAEEITQRAVAGGDVAAVWARVERKLSEPPDVSKLFEAPTVVTYPWTATYDGETYGALLLSQSSYALMEADQRSALMEGIDRLVDDILGGQVTKQYVTVLAIATRLAA